MTEATELARLERNLQEALEKYRAAEQAESYARKSSCDAQNVLNTAQKQLDAHIAKLRSSAPPESDWGTARRNLGRAA